jgi:hypothetical protein
VELLFKTVHGSHLYNLANPGSDLDTFEVHGWQKARARQAIVDGLDRTVTSYDRFMRYCEKGVPQYLEALWSRLATVDNLPFNRFAYQPDLTLARETYRRTVKNFWMAGVEEDSFKKRRHALRLALNWESLERTGLFNPTLNSDQRDFVNEGAKWTGECPEVPRWWT